MDSQGFDSELRTYYNEVKAEIKNEHSEYISKHPELREILNDFLSTVMLEKPANVYEYAQQHFSYYNIEKDKILFKPLIISGSSGSGKGTIIQMIISKYPQSFQNSISYTSRKPQIGETHGVEYFFVSREEFEKEISKGSFLEYSILAGEYYGIHKGKLEAIIQSCKVAFLEIDVAGARKIQREHPDWNYVFLNAPSLEELEKRMKSKIASTNKDIVSSSQIEERLKAQIKEIDESRKAGFFHPIINDDAEMCVEEFINYFQSIYKNLKL